MPQRASLVQSLAELSLGGADPIDQLDVRFFGQQQDEWCWAACLEMVLSSQGLPDRSQCQLADEAFNLDGCCGNPAYQLCNQPLSVSRVSSTYARLGLSSRFTNGPISFEQISEEIEQNRVVLAGLKFVLPGGIAVGHAIVIAGCYESQDGRFVIVYDPARNVGSDWYEDILSAYGRGVWFCTWTGLEG